MTGLLNRKVPDLYDPMIGGLPDLRRFQFCTGHGSSESITLQEKGGTEADKSKWQVFDSDPQYTLAAIEDELVYSLYAVTTPFLYGSNNIVPIRQKYVEQAKKLLYHINVFQPVPVFVINISDIPPSLQKQLGRFTCLGREDVITGGIARILEDLDPRYFRINGIRRNIKWRIEP